MQNERPVDPQEFATYLERLSVARNHPMSGELTMIFMGVSIQGGIRVAV